MTNKIIEILPNKAIRCFALFALLTLTSVSAYSQSMSVETFSLAKNDLTAILDETTKLDQNGEKCAVIKVETTLRGFQFDTGSLGVIDVITQNQEHPSEIWVYVPSGVKKITIQHPQLGIIRDYDLGISVNKGKTYILKLTTHHVNTMVLDYNNSQYLALKVFPLNAQVLINGVMQKTSSNGTLEIPMAFGTHNYRISAPNYHTAEGSFVINDKENKHNLSISLKQAFGYIDVTSPSNNEFDGADIYIDSIYVGKMPLTKFPLSSGLHNIKVYKALYKPYVDKFAVSDSSFTSITPTFAKNYAEVTITTSKNTQIYDRDSLLGTEKWQGRLEAGKHTILAIKAGHKSITKEVELYNGQETSIEMDAPTPIYGSIEIISSPSDATIYIDGKKYNNTPLIIPSILIGEHKVEILKNGYKTEIENVNIKEGETYKIDKKLTDYCNAIIDANTNAIVYINGFKIGETPCRVNQIAGTYMVKLDSDEYSPYSKKMTLDGSTKDMYIKLHRNYVKEFEFYLSGGYNPINFKLWQIGLGGYIFNINLEGNYLGNVTKSETIYLGDGEIIPVPVTYSPSGFNFKLGYGIRCNNRIRITPQIGIQYVQLKENMGKMPDDDMYHSNYIKLEYTGFADSSFAISTTLGARISFAIIQHLGISINPEYSLSIKQSKGYKVLSDVSSDINSYSKGINCSVNLNCFF